VKSCPSVEEWLLSMGRMAYLEQQRELRLHARNCGVCADRRAEAQRLRRWLARPAPSLGSDVAIARVLARLDAPTQPNTGSPGPRWWEPVITAAACIALLAAQVALHDLPSDDTYFGDRVDIAGQGVAHPIVRLR